MKSNNQSKLFFFFVSSTARFHHTINTFLKIPRPEIQKENNTKMHSHQQTHQIENMFRMFHKNRETAEKKPKQEKKFSKDMKSKEIKIFCLKEYSNYKVCLLLLWRLLLNVLHAVVFIRLPRAKMMKEVAFFEKVLTKNPRKKSNGKSKW